MAKAVKTAAKKATPAKAASGKTAQKKAAVKKVISKKAAAQKSETGIKYEDKSAGQPELVPIFEELKKLMLPYAKGSIKLRGGTGGQMALVSDTPVEINGKKEMNGGLVQYLFKKAMWVCTLCRYTRFQRGRKSSSRNC